MGQNITGDELGIENVSSLREGQNLSPISEYEKTSSPGLKMQQIPYVDADDRRNRKNKRFENRQKDQKIGWASPKKKHHER